MLNVLISTPNATKDPTYLPYVYGVLRTYCDRDKALRENLNWLSPIYYRDSPDRLLAGYDPGSIDVLGLTFYLWNWYIQKEIARRVKDENPGCLVVGGGPNCHASYPDFFRENPSVDVAVRREGEEPFRRILRKRLAGNRNWESIPGLCLPDEDGTSRATAPPRFLGEDRLLDVSPYRAQSPFFRRIIKETRNREESVFGLVEATRGCPYECSFCNWQQLTDTDVRQYPLDKIRGDIDWLVEHDVDATAFTDANVGMFERDVEISRHFRNRAEKNDDPPTVSFNPTKSESTHLPEIIENYHEADVWIRSVLPVQHTDPSVLGAINRANLPPGDRRTLIEFNRKNNIPVLVQLILGCPNDTYEKWKKCLADLMEWGIHGEYFVSPFHVLPEAPAGDPDYLERWGIETTLTRNVTAVEVDRDTVLPDVAHKKIVTETSTFDRREWIDMWVYSYLTQALHSKGLTRKLAQYCRFQEDVPYLDFYAGVTDELARRPGTIFRSLREEIRKQREEFLQGRDKLLDRRTTFRELPDYSYYPKWNEWVFVRLMLEKERTYEELRAFLTDRFNPGSPVFRDLIRFQKETMVDYEYDPEDGKAFTVRHDWSSYFSGDETTLSSPPPKRTTNLTVDQTHLGGDQIEINWHRHAGDERLRRWINAVVRDPVGGRADLFTTHTVKQRSRRPAN